MPSNATTTASAIDLLTGDSAQYAVLCIVVLTVVVYSGTPNRAYLGWAYDVGDQPVYRLLFLLAVAFIAPYSFPVTLMLVLLYMLVATRVPVLADLDERFVLSDDPNEYGPPVAKCSAYAEGPDYPLHNSGGNF